MQRLKYPNNTEPVKALKSGIAGVCHLAFSKACFISHESRHRWSWQGEIRQHLFSRFMASLMAQHCSEHCSSSHNTVLSLPHFLPEEALPTSENLGHVWQEEAEFLTEKCVLCASHYSLMAPPWRLSSLTLSWGVSQWCLENSWEMWQ